MKKILITGLNSFIGSSFENYIKQKFQHQYDINTIDMIDGTWREHDFSSYDVVFHVAGIAHSDTGKISSEKEALYRSVNTELTIETATKAKADGVKQFIFMSSAIVYGKAGRVGHKRIITRDTPTSPENCYAKSKEQAEKGLLQLADQTFKVVLLRCPMIYGKGCKGNFPVLEKLAKKLSFFPYVNNERSMLYIGNLVEFVRLVIENEEHGIFWPQNKEYVNTSELVQLLAKQKGRTLHLVHGTQWAIQIFGVFIALLNKAFGNLAYEKSLSDYKEEYRLYTLQDSIVELSNDNKL